MLFVYRLICFNTVFSARIFSYCQVLSHDSPTSLCLPLLENKSLKNPTKQNRKFTVRSIAPRLAVGSVLIHSRLSYTFHITACI